MPGAATTRGATAATSGSAKWPESPSIQPGGGSQSLSRNATNSLASAARPVLRAAPGPPLAGRRISRAPAARATARTASGSADPSSTTSTG